MFISIILASTTKLGMNEYNYLKAEIIISSYLSTMTDNWNKARKKCQERGNGELAVVTDIQTMNFIRENFNLNTGSAWIGGEKISGKWSWADGTKWNYTNWGIGQPNNQNDGIMVENNDNMWHS